MDSDNTLNNIQDMNDYRNKWIVSKNFGFTRIVAVGDTADEALEIASLQGNKGCYMIYVQGHDNIS